MTSGGDPLTCPKCGSDMVLRHNRETGEPFLGCVRFPACRGTRPAPMSAHTSPGQPPRPKVKLSTGERYAKSFPDVVELFIARRLGRTLSCREGCLVQAIALIGLFVAIYLFAISGAFMWIITNFAQWYASQLHFPGAPTPSP